jgi:Icc-related predicted phosphoesterase
MRIVAISDTHNLHDRISIPEGDVLVHCGDSLGRGSLAELSAFDHFLSRLPHRHKILIAGNHDWCFERQPDEARSRVRHAIYLQDESVEIEGLKFHGSPWQPWFLDWAFNLERGEPLREVWARIPEDTEVLVTHGPPHGILDRTTRGEPVGCEELRARVEELRTPLHLFGHIHEGYGSERRGQTLFVNASTCTVSYRPLQAPVVLDRKDGVWVLSGGGAE